MEMGGWHKARMKYKDGRSIFEDVYNKDNQEEVVVYMCGFDRIWR